jgi:hypothetical protein
VVGYRPVSGSDAHPQGPQTVVGEEWERALPIAEMTFQPVAVI